MIGLPIAESVMAEPVEDRLQDLERLVIKQAERIEALEQQLEALMRMARHGGLNTQPLESEAA